MTFSLILSADNDSGCTEILSEAIDCTILPRVGDNIVFHKLKLIVDRVVFDLSESGENHFIVLTKFAQIRNTAENKSEHNYNSYDWSSLIL